MSRPQTLYWDRVAEILAESAGRIVANDELPTVTISTVLLAHGRAFETVTFTERDGALRLHNGCSEQYRDRADAVRGHRRFVRLARVGLCGSCDDYE